MLEYEKIDISGPYLCDGCYNMMQKCNKLENIAVVHVKKSAFVYE